MTQSPESLHNEIAVDLSGKCDVHYRHPAIAFSQEKNLFLCCESETEYESELSVSDCVGQRFGRTRVLCDQHRPTTENLDVCEDRLMLIGCEHRGWSDGLCRTGIRTC